MSTGEIYAKLHQLREAAGIIRRSTDQINRSIEAIDSEVRTLSSDRFMSVGAEVFRAEYARLTPRLQETFELLGAFHDKLIASADDIEVAARTQFQG
ncbi:MAG: hypothetical protein SGI73_08875 [Chloroflexota bacterium]|nr:hypothetical protein [Chloroflexota bacterium]